MKRYRGKVPEMRTHTLTHLFREGFFFQFRPIDDLEMKPWIFERNIYTTIFFYFSFVWCLVYFFFSSVIVIRIEENKKKV